MTRRLGDLQAAEDALQDAFAAAAHAWPRDGVPARPGAWLMTTAWRKALDAVRRQARTVLSTDHEHHGEDAGRYDVDGCGWPAAYPYDGPEPVLDLDPVAREDDVLSLVLTCCHPSLSPEAQVALTLRHVVGLTDRQIAARFLLPEPTLTKRLVRARAKIRDAGIRFTLPDRTRLADRLDEVHSVVYLVFTEGYLASGDEESVRSELCEEAVWLARQLHRLVPDDPETTGLLALLLLQHARASARVDDSGALVTLPQQDRARWDTRLVDEARILLAELRTASQLGQYRLQGAIALLHASAPAGEQPDWVLIARLYEALSRVAPSPVVDVNHAVALGRSGRHRDGLALVEGVLSEPRHRSYLPALAARADLLEQAGDGEAASAWYDAAEAATDPAQRAQLKGRADRLLVE